MPQKKVIITGATGNLGNVVTQKFLHAGYTVMATVSPRSNIKPATENLSYHQVDLTDESQSKRFVEKVTSEHGPIHAALLLAGGFTPGKLEKTSDDDVNRMFALNFKTAFHIAHPLVAHMKQGNEGRIILIGAKPVLNAHEAKNSVAYSLSKSLIFKLAEILNAEGSDHNLTASVLVPGTIDTPDNRSAMPKADFSKWVSPDAMAEVMLRICADAGYARENPVIRMFG
jgi:NAD(P)-dependent dehydrogenase (short-subunit alcohol dehydrogenase family)